MNYGWIDFLTLVGSVGLFLYGMKLVSESLQKIAGDSLRRVLAAMTSNRFAGLLTGMLVTILVQSSSATTVMVVSFVNAGFISLAQSMAVIFGAHVGSTFTTWIISLFGFKFNIATLVLPMIALSLPFLNSTVNKRILWAEFIIGFALLFFGLDNLNHSVPDLQSSPEIFGSLQRFATMGYASVLIFLVVGIVLAMVMQASSVAFTIALIMLSRGWLGDDGYYLACAIVLGAKIGTCIMPMIAALSGNTMAKRAAMGNLLFNLVGAAWILVIFYPYCDFTRWLTAHIFGQFTPDFGLPMFHTTVSVINAVLMIGITELFVKAVTRIIPDKQTGEDAFSLKFISKGGIAASGELALVQASRETTRYASECYKMFALIRTMLDQPLGSEKQLELFETVKSLEEKSDEAEVEIGHFLNELSGKSLSADGELLSRRIYKMVDELESIADSIYHIAITLKFKSEQRIYFTGEMNTDLLRMVSLTDASLVHLLKVVETDDHSVKALNQANNLEDEINNYRNQLRNTVLDGYGADGSDYQQSSIFMELINECEKVGDYVINVFNAMHDR